MRKPRHTPAHYPIRAVSKLTGVAIDTLRAWERRHSAVTPVRDDRGRMYTEADVARLRLLRAAVEHGHSIGRLAGLTDAELRQLAATSGASAGSEAPSIQRAPFDTAGLIAALHKYDATGIDQQLSRLAAVLPPLELLRDILMPALAHVGDEWHRGPVRIAHEHLISSTMRNILGSFLRLYARPAVSTRLLFATLAGERHEIAHARRGDARRQQRVGRRVSRRRSSGARNRRQREAGRRAGAGARADHDIGREGAGTRTSHDRPRSPDRRLSCGRAGAAPRARPSIISPRGLVLRDYNAYQQELVRIGGHVA